jgi:hypothetical protein
MKTLTRRRLIATGAVFATGGFLSRAEAATGSIVINIFSAGFIVGVSGGGGTLTFEGNQYPLSVGGVSAGATIGVSGTDLVGEAYNLQNVRDIEGTYSAVSAGLSIAGGAEDAQLSNGRGVLLRLRGRQVGFMFSIDLSGLQISVT